MEAFYNTHNYLIDHLQSPVRRLLMDEIDWTHRLIGIKGSRGVGKTTFLLQYAREKFGHNRCCLYVNFNNLHFTQQTLVDFAGEFLANGGKTLLLDQIFKYENWSRELRQCYDLYPELHIVFTGSSVMRLVEENDDIQDVVAAYNLRGFSFREYLNLTAGTNFNAYYIQEILTDHEKISQAVCSSVNIRAYFDDYLSFGYYPFFLEKRNFTENLLKTMNMMLEVDILLIKKIELKYLPKIRKLLYILMQNAPAGPNVSQLSNEIETSRATIMNYIKYLKDARLINLLYSPGEEFPKKPRQIYVHNTNLLHVIQAENSDRVIEHKTFLYNTLHARHKVNQGKNQSDFLVDNEYIFRYDNQPARKQTAKTFYVADVTQSIDKNILPLWILGFLY